MARKTYNDEFKITTAKLVSEQGYSTRKAALSLGVDQASTRGWVRRFAPNRQRLHSTLDYRSPARY